MSSGIPSHIPRTTFSSCWVLRSNVCLFSPSRLSVFRATWEYWVVAWQSLHIMFLLSSWIYANIDGNGNCSKLRATKNYYQLRSTFSPIDLVFYPVSQRDLSLPMLYSVLYGVRAFFEVPLGVSGFRTSDLRLVYGPFLVCKIMQVALCRYEVIGLWWCIKRKWLSAHRLG